MTEQDYEARYEPQQQTPTEQAERAAKYGQVLRRWGLLDEVNNPKATEEFAVTSLLALVDAELAAVDRCTCRAATHQQHHTTPIPGCPWCTTEAARSTP